MTSLTPLALFNAEVEVRDPARCPLLAHLPHSARGEERPLLGLKRTFRAAIERL